MKKLTLILALMLGAVGCINFEGTFKADEKLKLVHTTMFGNEKIKTLSAGTYQTSFEFSSDEKMKLTFTRPGDDLDVKIKFSSSSDFPRRNGNIDLPASQTGQRYDIKGRISTDQSLSRTYNERERCSWTEYRTDCYVVCDGPRGSCRQVCNRIPVTRYGHQRVEYRYQYTERELYLELVKPQNTQSVADYNGRDRDTQKIYSFQGICR
jgi:hypothetical protein